METDSERESRVVREAAAFVLATADNRPFIRSLRSQVGRGKRLTVPQAMAALKIKSSRGAGVGNTRPWTSSRTQFASRSVRRFG